MATRTPSFGIKTTPAHVGYRDILRVWQEADRIPELEHAWLYDHLLPRVGRGGAADTELSGSVHEGWTLLSALAARTDRLRLGLLATNNRIRHPALLAKIAATVDEISGGRLDVGLGIGGLPRTNPQFPITVAPEYHAYGIPIRPWGEAVAAFAEACTLIRRLWTGDVFDFPGRYYTLTGARCHPRPVQRPYPPLLIAGAGPATLRIVAEHADIWNVIGPPAGDLGVLRERSRTLDEYCAEVGRDPGEITRSAQLVVPYEQPERTREYLRGLIDAGFTHLVLNPPAPYPDGVARWVTDEFVLPTLDYAS
ncbi:alkanesulfonate monooxygenase SsuD/methylene tetrahydromethanopterin reductase-like flavin-dependent oxidoreductase (luciferase family) [Nocardia transvalensis]|uniref:Alkanesulfonate monooxygenase SsuD/methylene tetrahydromethanopterin reductase-like flavin-dependent oxidoreductase (Luciferase family) n=1 Tax=Nocardia transvalensis TaxID=37333 RepID=A0A7W9PJY1_9NOCA|nr:LLM class flavin-dependent oxidoreductase [Nocardia transvalensis]MBB5917561.1 alkanesulfonate monooxygenase SsuD/methylene tetrahydromethanopterin reductase-like flavin-dependent oxidoreductase (luciferase family) [Nocardia transvalensis]